VVVLDERDLPDTVSMLTMTDMNHLPKKNGAK